MPRFRSYPGKYSKPDPELWTLPIRADLRSGGKIPGDVLEIVRGEIYLETTPITSDEMSAMDFNIMMENGLKDAKADRSKDATTVFEELRHICFSPNLADI